MKPTHALAAPRAPLLLDLGERLFVLTLAGLFFSRMSLAIDFNSLGASAVCNLLIMVSEGLTALFMLIRRPGDVATGLYAWAISIAGTCAPLMVAPGGPALLPAEASIVLMGLGLAITIAGKAVLRRSFGIVPANRGVQSGGAYGIVRHPIYAGYLLTHAGFLAANCSLWNLSVYCVCWLAMILRIEAEEQILSGDGDYRAYADQVRYRLIPRLW